MIVLKGIARQSNYVSPCIAMFLAKYCISQFQSGNWMSLQLDPGCWVGGGLGGWGAGVNSRVRSSISGARSSSGSETLWYYVVYTVHLNHTWESCSGSGVHGEPHSGEGGRGSMYQCLLPPIVQSIILKPGSKYTKIALITFHCEFMGHNLSCHRVIA